MSLSNCIKMLRQKAFLTQKSFAEEIGVTQTTVNRWETGKSRPNLSAMKAIKAFCVKYDFSYPNIEQEWFEYQQEEK